jgi:hypothetical protein
MKAAVIDENVLIVAEKQSADVHTNDVCLKNCVQALRDAREQIVVLDELGLMLQKYSKQLKPVRRDWEGSEFLIWLFDNQFMKDRCERVKITPLEPSFAEVPLELQNPDPVTNKIFDLDDHIWLAAAKASSNNPTILNATDTDWHEWLPQIEQHGFQIEFLCPDLMNKSRVSIP